MSTPADESYYQHSSGWIARRLLGPLSLRARRHMFQTFLGVVRPTARDRVLDVGVTGDQDFRESNQLEALYPHPHRIVALGRENLSKLRDSVPAVTCVQGDGRALPFRSASFDIVFSHATIEHAGDRKAQEAFIAELLRAGRRCFITTPNRWFPLELHTFLPVLHYLPHHWHRAILGMLGLHFYAQESNLNLLSKGELRGLFPSDVEVTVVFSALGTNLIAWTTSSGYTRR